MIGQVEGLPEILLFCELFYLIAVLDLVDKYFRGLEAGDEMLVDHDGGVARNVARNFFLSFLIDETAKTPHINIVATGHRVFHNGEKCFNRGGDIGFVNARFVRNLVDNVCFRHVAGCLRLGIRVGKINLCSQN